MSKVGYVIGHYGSCYLATDPTDKSIFLKFVLDLDLFVLEV